MTQAAPARPLALPIALVIGCAVCGAMLAMGLRQSFGLFLAPMTAENGWAARDFAFAIGLQVLINGISQPFMGQLADRFGGRRVVMGGAVLYCIGILGMALSESVVPFTFFAGFIMGMAVSAAGMPTSIQPVTWPVRSLIMTAGKSPPAATPSVNAMPSVYSRQYAR